MKTNRFLPYVIAASLSAGTALSASAEAKYVFYFIGDGMGMGHVNTTETYRRDILKTDSPLLMLTFPAAGQVRTYSANSPITDSAAAGTALSTGYKTNNYTVGKDALGNDVFSIASDFMKAGRAVGILTSVAGDDATPASFYAHSEARGNKEEISAYAPESGVKFFGAPVFKGMTDKEGNPTDWVERMQKAGYTLTHRFDDLARNPNAEKVLMLAENPCGEQLGYTLDTNATGLTLQEMTEAALSVVSTDPDGFFMMVEGGNIDWAAHANDGASVIKEVLNFQNAIDVAYKFYTQHPDETLIVITADHDTGGMALGRIDNPKNPQLGLIDAQKISKDRFADRCRELYKEKSPTWDEMQAFMAENLGIGSAIILTPEEEEAIGKSFDDTFVTHRAADQKTLYNDFNRFTVTLYDILNRHYGIAFTSPSHTANFVPVYAIGDGSSLFGTSLDNTQIPGLILRAAGLQK